MVDKTINEIISILESDLNAGIKTIKDFQSLNKILETLAENRKFQLSKELIGNLMELDSPLIEDKEIKADILNIQTENGFYLQDYEFAEANARQELELRKHLEDKNKLAESYNNLATIGHVTGKIADAERYYQSAIDSCPKDNYEKVEQYSFSLANLNQHYVGDHDKAIRYYQKAYDCAKDRGDKSKFAFYIVHIAVAQKSKRLFSDALASFAQASLLIEDENSIINLYSLHEQYETLRDAERWEEAEKVFEYLVSKFEKVKDNSEMLASLYIYAAELMMSNRATHVIEKLNKISGYRSTEEYIKNAIEISENVPSKRVYIMANILAFKYFKKNELGKAKNYLEKAESVAKSQSRIPWQNIINSLINSI